MSNTSAVQSESKLRVILLVEDDGARSHQRPTVPGHRTEGDSKVTVRVHEIRLGEWKTVRGHAKVSRHRVPSKTKGLKQTVALDLLSRCTGLDELPVIVASANYGGSGSFVRSLVDQKLDFVLEVRPSHRLECKDAGSWVARRLVDALDNASWQDVEITPHKGQSSIRYSVADLATVRLPDGVTARLFAAQTGGIVGVHPGTIIGLTSLRATPLKDLVRYIGWARWIRPLVRQQEKALEGPPAPLHESSPRTTEHDLMLQYRSNISLSRLQDKSAAAQRDANGSHCGPRGKLFATTKVLNVVELFAGAGGMGLGFLMAEHSARRFRLVFAGELHPIYVRTLKSTHEHLVRMCKSHVRDFVPSAIEPLNLDEHSARERVLSTARAAGTVDVLVGGPPCQGFSSANRNSDSVTNPQNQMVNVFMKYVDILNPSVFLIENVQGIAWTAKNDPAGVQPSVAGHFVKRMRAAGYVVFPKLLDAVWYGVPQFRTRLFVLGIRTDAGYRPEDFGDWGPFPLPTHGPLARRSFVTVREAIGDLPQIGNGHREEETNYSAPKHGDTTSFLRLMRSNAPSARILDHVTSRHADYVIKRYRCIPAGGNWQDIAELMTNYSRLERTHSNIYRRLEWDEPSVTIGHYRKSMLVHPEQHRGLSLREATRLQSFPDWFRFAGTEDGLPGGLMHKQQQLANAVCPLVSKAIAEFLLEL